MSDSERDDTTADLRNRQDVQFREERGGQHSPDLEIPPTTTTRATQSRSTAYRSFETHGDEGSDRFLRPDTQLPITPTSPKLSITGVLTPTEIAGSVVSRVNPVFRGISDFKITPSYLPLSLVQGITQQEAVDFIQDLTVELNVDFNAFLTELLILCAMRGTSPYADTQTAIVFINKAGSIVTLLMGEFQRALKHRYPEVTLRQLIRHFADNTRELLAVMKALRPPAYVQACGRRSVPSSYREISFDTADACTGLDDRQVQYISSIKRLSIRPSERIGQTQVGAIDDES